MVDKSLIFFSVLITLNGPFQSNYELNISKMDQTKKPPRNEFIRSQSFRLPTPPPDPNSDISETCTSINEDPAKLFMDKENEFLEYLNSLPLPAKVQLGEQPNLQRSTSIFAPAIAAEDAFDHLDKLYKLMEQLLNLREQNSKLQRRVRDLEHLKNLQNIHNDVTKAEEVEIPEIDEDTVLAEALLDNMFTATNKRSTKQKSPQFKFRQSILRPQRDRSCSLAAEPEVETRPGLPRNCSGKSLPESVRKPSKVSKWTKVKAAFKWEKTSPTVTGAKSQDSGIGGMQPVNTEVARYLRVPSTFDNGEGGASPADSVLSGSWQGVHGISTPGTLSPASSTDELNPSTRSGHRCVSRTASAGNNNPSSLTCRRSRTSDDDESDRRSRSLDFTGSSPYDSANALCKNESAKLLSNKSHKTPWGKVKDIIQTRKDSLKKKQHRLSTRSDDCRTTDYSAGSDQEDVFEPSSEEIKPPTVTVTTTAKEPKLNSLENNYEQKIPPDVLARYQRAVEEDKLLELNTKGSPRDQRHASKWAKVKQAFLTSASISRNDDETKSSPSSPTKKQCHFFIDEYKLLEQNEKCLRSHPNDDFESRRLKEEIYKSYEDLQKKLSQEFQEKLQEWEKIRTNSGNSTSSNSQNVSSGCGSGEEQCDPEFARKIKEWERIKHAESQKRRNLQMTSEENLPADFKKKLQEWQKIKKFGGTYQEDARKKKSEWQLWRSNSTQKQDSQTALGQPDNRQYSEDFLKKLDEWKQMKSAHANEEVDKTQNKTPSPGLTRKSSKLMRQSKKHKMQEWLEKELLKIEREKQRLEKEKEKFLEREERLAKLRRSISCGPNKKDVLVQTSTGFYRFEGISRKFTQRLYEWEKARGIAPEDSTFALLSIGYNQIFPNPSRTNQGNKQVPRIKLTRSKSMDSVANLTCSGPIITHQPSSLSLNDMEELEMQCMAAESQSEHNLNESEDNLAEPEAVIVDVEDFVEETAAPLESHIKHNQQTPVYHTEEIKLCESEKCEAPQVRRSESAKALSNYNLIQESLNILNKMRANEDSCKLTQAQMTDVVRHNQEKAKQDEYAKTKGAIPKRKQVNNKTNESQDLLQDILKDYFIQQIELSQSLSFKISLLQDANSAITKNVSTDNSGYTIIHLSDTLNIMQDLSVELITLTDKLKITLSERKTAYSSLNVENVEDINDKYGQDICEYVNMLIFKIKELKRSLSYLCAATDMTAPGRRKKGSYKERKNSFYKRASLEQMPVSQQVDDNTSDEEDRINNKTKLTRRREKLVKSKSEDNQMINHVKLQVTSAGIQRIDRTECRYQLNRPSASLTHVSCENSQILSTKGSQDDTSNEKTNHETFRKNIRRKLFRTKRISDSHSDSNTDIDKVKTSSIESVSKYSEVIIDKMMPGFEEFKHSEAPAVIIPTNTNFIHLIDRINEPTKASPVSVFVHTTRNIFTQFAPELDECKTDTSINQCNAIFDPDSLNNKLLRRSHSPSGSPLLPRKKRMTSIETKDDETEISRPSTPSYLPPLPNSPIPQRRERPLTKETSPAIRLMIARYNQKLSEHETTGNRSGGSSGSASPVAWRSPVLERRVRAQTERYQEEVSKPFISSKYSPLFARKQVQKSASASVMNPPIAELSNQTSSNNASPKLIRGILKSTSMDSKVNHIAKTIQIADSIRDETEPITKKPHLKLSIPPSEPEPLKSSPILQERANKLQKAKEEFLNQDSLPASPKSAPPIFRKEHENSVKYPARNRLSQVSVGSESSCDEMKYQGLTKSASAGMINIDEIAYQQFRPEIHSQGYVSLPRATKKKNGKFGISSLASKFRKVKMRRSKDSAQMNTVSTLCRQSLIVDITDQNDDNNSPDLNNIQPTSSKTNWIKNPSNIFKSK